MQQRSLTVAAATVFTLMLSSPTWAAYQARLDAYKEGEYANALKDLQPLALTN